MLGRSHLRGVGTNLPKMRKDYVLLSQRGREGTISRWISKFCRKRTEQRDARKIRRGMTRHLFLIVDFSKSMSQTDFKPSRLTVTMNVLEAFIKDYFDQNPLSQLGLI